MQSHAQANIDQLRNIINLSNGYLDLHQAYPEMNEDIWLQEVDSEKIKYLLDPTTGLVQGNAILIELDSTHAQELIQSLKYFFRHLDFFNEDKTLANKFIETLTRIKQSKSQNKRLHYQQAMEDLINNLLNENDVKRAYCLHEILRLIHLSFSKEDYLDSEIAPPITAAVAPMFQDAFGLSDRYYQIALFYEAFAYIIQDTYYEKSFHTIFQEYDPEETLKTLDTGTSLQTEADEITTKSAFTHDFDEEINLDDASEVEHDFQEEFEHQDGTEAANLSSEVDNGLAHETPVADEVEMKNMSKQDQSVQSEPLEFILADQNHAHEKQLLSDSQQSGDAGLADAEAITPTSSKEIERSAHMLHDQNKPRVEVKTQPKIVKKQQSQEPEQHQAAPVESSSDVERVLRADEEIDLTEAPMHITTDAPAANTEYSTPKSEESIQKEHAADVPKPETQGFNWQQFGNKVMENCRAAWAYTKPKLIQFWHFAMPKIKAFGRWLWPQVKMLAKKAWGLMCYLWRKAVKWMHDRHEKTEKK